MNRPSSFISETENYWVLDKYESSSEPGKFYEVRTSKRDGKTYCTCRGWIVRLNQSKVTGGEAVCKHIELFRTAVPNAPLVIMNFEEFATVRRGIALVTKKKVAQDINVRRS